MAEATKDTDGAAIYKGKRKPDTYLYIEREGDFARVPESLKTMLGELTHVMTIELSKKKKLAQADVVQVISALRLQGYYLQLPPSEIPQRPLNVPDEPLI